MEETARRSEFKDDLSIDAPIPGQSLTAPLGDRPWQNPPEYVEVEDALEYYIPKVLDPEFSVELLDIIEMGIPLTTIANSLQLASVMEGKHSIDVGILVIPVLVELMITLADANEVEYVSGMSREKEKGLSNAQIALAKKKGMLDKDMKVEEPTPEPTEEPEEEPNMGLMSRRENVQ